MRGPYAWKQWVAAVILLSIAPALATADDGLPPAIPWRQTAFSIPFKVATTTAADQTPTEIRLYVSTNQGMKWDLAQKVQPTASNFTYRAPADGEFWFLIRSVDSKGQVQPELGTKPELRVIVDTVAPRLDISAVRGESGEIRTTWQAVDPLLNVDSLKIEYQGTDGKWRPVAIDRPPGGSQRSTTSGTMTWWPTDVTGGVKIRAEISDRAGNVTVTQATADTANHSEVATGKHTAPGSGAANTPGSGGLPPLLSGTSGGLASSDAWTSTAPPPRNQSPASSSTAAKTPSAGGSGSTGPTLSKSANAAGNQAGSPWPADRVSSDPFGRAPINTAAVPEGPMESTVNPPIRNQATMPRGEMVSAKRESSEESATPTGPAPSSNSNYLTSPPPGEKPRMVNSRTFDLEYDVDGVGPYGIAKVELWGTRDGGRNWTSYGIDNDNRSPIRATVEGEGLYGFRISVQSGNGLGGQPPRSGDLPQMWVGVDLTKPVVRITGIEPGSGEHTGELMIRWEASDAALAARPITLKFTDRPGGAWSIIAAGLENTGSYTWRPDSRAPDRIFLRIEARDEAGNTATYDSTESTSLDRIRPEGRIREVRPAGEAAFRAWIDGGVIGR